VEARRLNDTTFFTAQSSLTIDSGMLSTGSLTTFGGVNGMLSISDPARGTAITVGGNDSDSTFTGTITDAAGGPGSLRKTGTGTLTLTGANTYTGGTIIDGGTLLAENLSGSATGSGDVLVNGGMLGGNGIVGGTATAATGGTVAPGTSTGVLTVNSVNFENSS
jgi:autotransporter-associated beta strand protein